MTTVYFFNVTVPEQSEFSYYDGLTGLSRSGFLTCVITLYPPVEHQRLIDLDQDDVY